MKYCQSCVLPATRPNLSIDRDGICNACKSHGSKREVNWDHRKHAFSEVVENTKNKSDHYDCIIPVSGGKDSTWQVVKCLDYGLKPLAVTWRTPGRTALGEKNLNNLIGLGVDHIDYQISPVVEKKFMYKAFAKYGSTAIPMHMAIFSIPLRLAVHFRIPLVIWGENSAFEYGSESEEYTGFTLDNKWIKKFGVTHGTTANDWVDSHISKKDLSAYILPTDDELLEANVRAIFLGYYFNWDPDETFKVAKENGFLKREEGPKTGAYNYADIDDNFISVHHWMKWYKFGFTRLFDNLSLEIRNKRMSRAEAVNTIKDYGDQTPYSDITCLAKFLNVKESHIFDIAENFRNQDIWFKDSGVWKIKDYLVPDWDWK